MPRDTGQFLEVTDGAGIYIHATDAAEFRLKGAHTSVALVEAGRTAAKARE